MRFRLGEILTATQTTGPTVLAVIPSRFGFHH
jgi:hypothetical protein